MFLICVKCFLITSFKPTTIESDILICITILYNITPVNLPTISTNYYYKNVFFN